MRMKPAESRIAAGLILLVVVAIVYVVFVHWWFVAPQQQMSADMAELRDTEQRYAAAIAERPQLEKRLAALSTGQSDSKAFLPEDDANAASAGLMQRMVDIAAAHHDAGSCEVVQKTTVPNQDKPGDPYRKVSVNIYLRCQIEALGAVLNDVEQGTPYLFVDEFSAYRNPAPQSGPALEVQLTVSGYVRQVAPAKVKS